MKHAKISINVIRRLPRYLRKLDDLAYHGVERISSGELGRKMGLTPSQIRQDFSCFGEFGQQGYGYNVSALREQISVILGMDQNYRAILVGAGNLGHALLHNFGFTNCGLQVLAGFDISVDLVGTEVAGVPILHVDDMERFVQENRVDIAVLATPRRFAQNLAKTLATYGVPAIWNFTNLDLDLNEEGVLVENIHFSDSLLALSYFLTEARRENEETEA